MEGGTERGGREGEREGERQVKKGRRERKICFFSGTVHSLFHVLLFSNARGQQVPPHSTLAVIHTLFDVAPRRNMG